ncbi:hypothetical protein [Xylella fastidiosa]|uniref:Uncharacterized protein n=2 Tax=Xylella fastidiosa TaxID=2371 RepID=Q9PHF7_XYLFA|nr:hypothetical protein [Xylella fastidiosa]AAF85619.1 hypothetical protein XF_a0051 [Xylella fastidiosa 9a5c]ALQ96027.1 hypothetical protein XFUD_12420 [Xylella fastidiosa]ALR03264.1 hypothetical protein OY18_13330 [Xylella fastidiosa]KXB10308.1 hypothetical protein ADT29_00045 [Xylella fastidiosa]KXB17489.1 hypothetical protein ADT30_00355 [Xylella fastidiosa]
MTAPRTTREALIAELLGDVDGLLTRVEALPVMVAAAEEKMTSTAKALEDAGDKYRMAVTAFTEQAKIDLSEYLDMKSDQAGLIATKTVEEQRATLQEAARLAFRSEVSDKAASLSLVLSQAAKDFRRSMWTRLIEHTVTALVASGFTASLVYLIVKR